MDIYRRMPICAVVAFIAVAGCGDEKGYESLDDFYGARSGAGPSTSSSSGGGSSSGTPSGKSCGVSTSSLLAYLPFDGDIRIRGGSSFTPTSSSMSSPRFVTGKRGSALSGSDQIFFQANTSIASSSWTFCAWVRMGGSPAMGLVVAPPVDVGVGAAPSTAPCGSGSLAPYVTSSATGCFSPSSMSLSPGEWSFICLVNDASEGAMRFVVDGERETRSPPVPLKVGSGSAIAFGGGPEDGSSGIDEVSLWSRALEDEEIEKLSGAGTACAVIQESP